MLNSSTAPASPKHATLSQSDIAIIDNPPLPTEPPLSERDVGRLSRKLDAVENELNKLDAAVPATLAEILDYDPSAEPGQQKQTIDEQYQALRDKILAIFEKKKEQYAQKAADSLRKKSEYPMDESDNQFRYEILEDSLKTQHDASTQKYTKYERTLQRIVDTMQGTLNEVTTIRSHMNDQISRVEQLQDEVKSIQRELKEVHAKNMRARRRRIQRANGIVTAPDLSRPFEELKAYYKEQKQKLESVYQKEHARATKLGNEIEEVDTTIEELLISIDQFTAKLLDEESLCGEFHEEIDHLASTLGNNSVQNQLRYLFQTFTENNRAILTEISDIKRKVFAIEATGPLILH